MNRLVNELSSTTPDSSPATHLSPAPALRVDGTSGGNGENQKRHETPPRDPTRSPRPRKKRFAWLGELLLALCVIAALLCLAWIGRVSQESTARLVATTHSVAHSREVLEKLQLLLSSLHDVESGARGYAITGKEGHLNPYHVAVATVPQQIDELKRLIQDNRELRPLFGEAEPLIRRHLQAAKELVDLGNKNLFRAGAQRGATDQGHQIMSQVRESLRKMERQEREVLNQQEAQAASTAVETTTMIIGGASAACGLVLLLGLIMLRAIRGRKKAEGKLSGFLESTPDAIIIVNKEGKIVVSNTHAEQLFGYTRNEIEGQTIAVLVPERFRKVQMQQYSLYFTNRCDPNLAATLELYGVHKDGREFPIEISMKPLQTGKGVLVTSAIRDTTKRKEVEQEIAKLNTELEERASQAEAANKELEAFSYSVSHDLRSPLQSIDGFSQILLEDYSPRLDHEGQDYLQRVRASCQHMGEIIDALLSLSKMMRTELCREKVDLSAMAGIIATELKTKGPEREVDFVIAEGVVVDADARLMRAVLENLMGNAWKFTSKHPRARIEFGTMRQSNGEKVYLIRDDGAGFDMAHATKLFTPFKRLHDMNTFQGTGIGLATVQRVIARHGGTIWADGAVEQGATFCFTLP